ncbi:MAG TPA: winged helix-turn-helix domain-containing protein [Methylomirabilota bacterium]|nr:winged helix-turn-helix domain-containing protein [Methylomirabilota bacterium]
MEPGRFRFGLFELDSATGELRREGTLVKLQPQPAQLLACLVERAGEVVSREDLRQAVWGAETFVDFDSGLNFCISQIRTALRDDAAEPRYVRTIPKAGYQFIAPAERIAGRAPQLPLTAKVNGRSGGSRILRASLGLAGLLAVALAVTLATMSHFRGAPGGKSEPIVAVLRFDNETGDAGLAGFSDGVTDHVVEQLTTAGGGCYRVIGNAQILRLPREQRDLTAVASSLHAGYVVLGQVQRSDSQVRILAHLIRLPDQTHVWVVRMDGSLEDPLRVELDSARKIASEFSPRLMASFQAAGLTPGCKPLYSH